MQVHILGEGLTRIALRKYTSFGVHLAVKHFGARPGMHPNIDRFSIRTGVRWYGMAGFAGAVGDFLLAAVAFIKESQSVGSAGNQGQP